MVDLATARGATSLSSLQFSGELREFVSQGIPGTFEKAGEFLRGLSEYGDRVSREDANGSRSNGSLPFDRISQPLATQTDRSLESLRETLLIEVEKLRAPLTSFGTRAGMLNAESSLDTLIAEIRQAGKLEHTPINGAHNGSEIDNSPLKEKIETAINTFTRFLERTQEMQNGSGLNLLAYYEGRGSQDERRELRKLLNQTTNALREVLTASKN